MDLQKILSFCENEGLEILKEIYNICDNVPYYLQQYLFSTNKNGHTLDKLNNSIDKNNNLTNIVIAFTVLNCIILGTIVYLLIIKNKKATTSKRTQKKKEENLQFDSFNISKETVDRILNSLEEFENNNAFIIKDISIFSIANQFQTNTKYLSTIIKRYKNKTFTQYINDLRIQYIISKLKTDPNFSKYKIYYLSELSGFSSQRAFTIAFVNNTNMKPLEYIKKNHPIKSKK
ncbi:hypothetical protein CMT45_16930 [Elizabethkingia anophelis]|nr:hypothetical protein [Elizabethkingia anophelis]